MRISRFFQLLPLRKAENIEKATEILDQYAKSRPLPEPMGRGCGNWRVLLVEDCPDQQRLTCRFLKGHVAEVDLECNGDASVELVYRAIREKNRFDLIILDLYSIADTDWILRGKSEVSDTPTRQARGVLWLFGTILIGVLLASFLDRLVRAYGSQLSSIQRQLDIAAHKTSEGLWYWDATTREFWYNDRLCHLLQRASRHHCPETIE